MKMKLFQIVSVGSGTTCVAAKELNRKFIGIEIDPEYHKISMDRLNGILANGQISFDTDINKLQEAKDEYKQQEKRSKRRKRIGKQTKRIRLQLQKRTTI